MKDINKVGYRFKYGIDGIKQEDTKPNNAKFPKRSR